MNKWKNIILNGLLPRACLLCYETTELDHHLCASCWDGLPRIRYEDVCPRCASALDTAAICGNCLKYNYHFDHTIAGAYYHWPIPELIKQYKFSTNRCAGLSIAKLMSQQLSKKYTLHYRVNHFGPLDNESIEQRLDIPQVLIPVPMHPLRQKERGFNPAFELATMLSRQYGLPVKTDWVYKTTHTAPQSMIDDASDRQKNVRYSFDLVPKSNKRHAWYQISNNSKFRKKIESNHQVMFSNLRHVAIVDDVLTTGSTVSELAKTLKGANPDLLVSIIVCARA